LADSDSDGIYDSVDNCVNHANTLQKDSDGDGYGNICDGDFDNDGKTTWGDGAKLFNDFVGTDNSHGDFNNDGWVNAADLLHMRDVLLDKPPGPSGRDIDGDGVANHLDNCVFVSNGPWTDFPPGAVFQQNQADADNDFFGDLCDGDLNNDGVVNFDDATIISNKIANQRYYQRADFDADGDTDQDDKDYLAGLFSWPESEPGPSGTCRYSNVTLGGGCDYD
jgi:hypothetical protein